MPPLAPAAGEHVDHGDRPAVAAAFNSMGLAGGELGGNLVAEFHEPVFAFRAGLKSAVDVKDFFIAPPTFPAEVESFTSRSR